MWLSKQMIAAARARPAAETAAFTGESAAQGSAEYRGIQIAAPWGVAYSPPQGADAVLVESARGPACVGTIVSPAGIEPGELLLYSAGGASIHLKNTGEVVINGRVFAPEKG